MDQNKNDASRASVESFVPRPQYRLDCPKYHNLVMEAIEEEKAERKRRRLFSCFFPSSWIAAFVWLLGDDKDPAWHGDKLIKSIRDKQGQKQ